MKTGDVVSWAVAVTGHLGLIGLMLKRREGGETIVGVYGVALVYISLVFGALYVLRH